MNTHKSFSASATITRPADVTAYTALDAIGDTTGSAILTFFNIGNPGGNVYLTDLDMQWRVAALPAGATTFRLHLYNASPDAIADNAAWDLASAGDRGKYLGYIDLLQPTDIGSSLYSQNNAVNKLVTLAADSNTLYGVLVTTAGYTPAASEVYVLGMKSVEA